MRGCEQGDESPTRETRGLQSVTSHLYIDETLNQCSGLIKEQFTMNKLNSNQLTSINDEPKKKRVWRFFKITIRVVLTIYRLLTLIFGGDP